MCDTTDKVLNWLIVGILSSCLILSLFQWFLIHVWLAH